VRPSAQRADVSYPIRLSDPKPEYEVAHTSPQRFPTSISGEAGAQWWPPSPAGSNRSVSPHNRFARAIVPRWPSRMPIAATRSAGEWPVEPLLTGLDLARAEEWLPSNSFGAPPATLVRRPESARPRRGLTHMCAGAHLVLRGKHGARHDEFRHGSSHGQVLH
jgi:hypothetical protein